MKQIFHMHEKVSGGSRFFQMEERKPKNCMKMNKVGPKWGRTQGPPPVWNRHRKYNISSFAKFNTDVINLPFRFENFTILHFLHCLQLHKWYKSSASDCFL